MARARLRTPSDDPELEKTVREAIGPCKLVAGTSLGLPEKLLRPWLVAHKGKEHWAVYLVNSGLWPSAIEESVHHLCISNELPKPCVLASSEPALAATASRFMSLQIPVIVRVGDRGRLMWPPVATPATPTPEPTTRVLPTWVDMCGTAAAADPPLSRLLARTATALRRIRARDDEAEARALGDFSADFLRLHGLLSDPVVTKVLALMESALPRARDHYFHSYQVLFLGLWVVLGRPKYFRGWPASRVRPGVPALTWFFTALWHDCGYTVRRLNDFIALMQGTDEETDCREKVRQFLDSPRSQLNLTRLADDLTSLRVASARLKRTRKAKARARVRAPARHLRDVLFDNAFESSSHGVLSAVLLRNHAERLTEGLRSKPMRALLMSAAREAAASIPLHDRRVRKAVRKGSGACTISCDRMPHAALLAYVDSIQEDRRAMDDGLTTASFVWSPLIADGRRVEAQLDPNALPPDAVLWKMLEAHDVTRTLHQTAGKLAFAYPRWLVSR